LESLKDIRDKAIFSVLFYSWCRVSALINLTVTDYYERGGTRWLRFQEKRGKEHEVPVHTKAKEAVDLWLERSSLASNSSAPLFPSFGKNRETLNWRRLDRRSVLKLVEKRAKASGILKRVCCHSFRATGVTEYMNSGGTIEIAQRIAGHTSPSTTRIYDRSGDRLTLEEIERVQIGKIRSLSGSETRYGPITQQRLLGCNAKDPSPLKVKEIWVEKGRYFVCLNEEERRKDAHDREAIVAHLKEQLRRGDKSLVGNKGYRRYLKVQGESDFALDEKRIKAEACYDGIWVLRTNTDYNAETVAHVYKNLWTVDGCSKPPSHTFHNFGFVSSGSANPTAFLEAISQECDARASSIYW
jgi:Phage integrase family